MSKKTIALVLFAVVLGVVYVIYFTDLFSKPSFAISWRPRVERSRSDKNAVPSFTGSFSFDTRSKLRLTEVKIVSVADAETNKYPHAVWHLISTKGSTPTKGIVYGEIPKGMKPHIPKLKAEPLQPGTRYRIYVEAGKRTGVQEFDVPGRKTVQ